MKGESFSVTPGTHPTIFDMAPVEIVLKAHIDPIPVIPIEAHLTVDTMLVSRDWPATH